MAFLLMAMGSCRSSSEDLDWNLGSDIESLKYILKSKFNRYNLRLLLTERIIDSYQKGDMLSYKNSLSMYKYNGGQPCFIQWTLGDLDLVDLPVRPDFVKPTIEETLQNHRLE